MTLPALVSEEAPELAGRLQSHLAGLGPMIVAFSGGVDSSVVLKAAAEALADKAIGVMARTESNTDEDLDAARALANEHGLNLRIIEYSELAIPNYAENPTNRCFFCKNELYTRLAGLAEQLGIPVICDGSNADDVGDWRPGLKAVAKHGVHSPLKELGFTKAQVRAAARHYGLPNHDKPSSPCLSSRIPYGSKVTREKLDQIAAAERLIRDLGFVEFRCRHHGDVARLEFCPADLPRALECREALASGLREIGFQWVTLDLEGFRSGSLNRVLTAGSRASDALAAPGTASASTPKGSES